MAARIVFNEAVDDQVVNLIAACGGSPNADLVKDIIHTALRAVIDGTDRGDLKILSRSLRELRYAFKVFAPYKDRRKISIFGSARTSEDEPIYAYAAEFGRRIADAGFMVITGAGEGIMEAGHRGAGRDRSFGLNIRLPFEQAPNEVIENDPKLILFHYFFTRKLFFVKEADGLVFFPGGFGTNDETYESMTLVQTGKSEMVPLVMLDVPGGTYWREWEGFVSDHLVRRGLIAPEDLSLFTVTDSIDAAIGEIERFYRVYHSSRYVHDALVLRLTAHLPPETVEALNDSFSDILADGRIESAHAFPEEANEPQTFHLPRLVLRFNRKRFGRLRQLIDAVNRAPVTPEAHHAVRTPGA
ncbi:MAG: hypothetical protein A2V83_02960 [Nitrospirae bacterium RBG_16_64_22]|nr:MAG: hypothetical protein A2V83_02960 [Nitrospirae bacterium RBG_16_64_22]